MTTQPDTAPLSREAEALAAWQEAVADCYDQIRAALASPSRGQRAVDVVNAIGRLNGASSWLIEAISRGPYEPGRTQREERAG